MVNEFAKKNGYDKAIYRGLWKGYKVYEPILSEEGACVGLPYFILVNKAGMRMCDQSECLVILSAINEE